MTQDLLLQKRIRFRSNGILTRALVQELYDYPHEVFALLSAGRGDGILAGMEFYEAEDAVWLSPGMVRLGEGTYILHRPVSLSDIIKTWTREHGQKGREYHILLEADAPVQEPGAENGMMEVLPLGFKVGEAPATRHDQLHLCSFSDLVDPKRLPDAESDEPEEAFTSRGCLHLLGTPWAARGGATFHPYVFRALARLLEAQPRKTGLDYALLFALQKDGVVPLATLRTYVAECGLRWEEGADRGRLFQTLCECVRRKREDAPRGEAPPKEAGGKTGGVRERPAFLPSG